MFHITGQIIFLQSAMPPRHPPAHETANTPKGSVSVEGLRDDWSEDAAAVQRVGSVAKIRVRRLVRIIIDIHARRGRNAGYLRDSVIENELASVERAAGSPVTVDEREQSAARQFEDADREVVLIASAEL